MAIEIEIKDIANANIDYSKKALIPPFEFALVKNLHRDNRRVLDGTVLQSCQQKKTCAATEVRCCAATRWLTCRNSHSSTDSESFS